MPQVVAFLSEKVQLFTEFGQNDNLEGAPHFISEINQRETSENHYFDSMNLFQMFSEMWRSYFFRRIARAKRTKDFFVI